MNDIRDAIAARRESSQQRAQQALGVLRDRFLPLQDAFLRKLRQATQVPGPRDLKIRLVDELLSDVRALSADLVACRAGCDRCCHLRVVMHQAEAEALGRSIGVEPRTLPPDYRMAAKESYGADTPCSFLREGTCTIYADRPFVCRDHVNLDEDALLCSFENLELARNGDPRAVDIPILDAGVLQQVYEQLGAGGIVGDIRDFFPDGLGDRYASG